MNFLPDWSGTWTREEAEVELPNFVWNGPGVYANQSDTMLVYPVEREPEGDLFWAYESKPGEHFQFLVYNGRNVGSLINSFHPYVPVRV